MKSITLEGLLSNTTKTSNGCMEWNGARTVQGYGVMYLKGRATTVSRIVLLLAGLDLKGRYACHKCDNPPCINPEHLFPGTQKENIQDAITKGRRRRAIRRLAKKVKLVTAPAFEWDLPSKFSG